MLYLVESRWLTCPVENNPFLCIEKLFDSFQCIFWVTLSHIGSISSKKRHLQFLSVTSGLLLVVKHLYLLHKDFCRRWQWNAFKGVLGLARCCKRILLYSRQNFAVIHSSSFQAFCLCWACLFKNVPNCCIWHSQRFYYLSDGFINVFLLALIVATYSCTDTWSAAKCKCNTQNHSQGFYLLDKSWTSEEIGPYLAIQLLVSLLFHYLWASQNGYVYENGCNARMVNATILSMCLN